MPTYQPYSFSGTDFRCIAYFGDQFSRTGELSQSVELLPTTVSVSIASEKTEVRRLNHNYAVGFTNTITTVAGTLVFSMINSDPLDKLKKLQIGTSYSQSANSYEFADEHMRRGIDKFTLSAEAIEPFTIKLIGITEADYTDDDYRADQKYRKTFSYFLIEGIEITGSGQVLSVHNVLTEKTYTFRARRFSELTSTVEMVEKKEKTESGTVALGGEPLTRLVTSPMIVA